MTQNEIDIHLSRIIDRLFAARQVATGIALEKVDQAYRHAVNVRDILKDEGIS